MQFLRKLLQQLWVYGRYPLLVGSLWFVGHVTWIVIDGFNDEIQHADVAVVYGNKVHPNGKPSKRLRMRLDRALELYRKGWFPHIVVSGGVGVEGRDEAVVMKQYLVKHGVPARVIHVDSKGINTFHTSIFTTRLLRKQKWRSVLLISQYYHITRAKLTHRRFGVSNVYSAHATYHFEWREPYSILREVAGFYVYLLRPIPQHPTTNTQ